MADFVSDVTEAERQQTIADLKAARAELVARGRCTGSPLGWQGAGVCTVGAAIAAVAPQVLNEATPTFEVFKHSRALAVVLALHRFLPDAQRRPVLNNADIYEINCVYDVSTFNDDRGTSTDDVLNLFDKALADIGGLA